MTRPYSYCTILLALSLFACHQGQPSASGNAAGIPDRLASAVTGTYTGHYSKGLITLVINYIGGNIASGYDIHKGLRRNLNGQVEQNGARLSFVLKEPGGNPYDGTFFLSFDTATNKLSGKWVPADSTKAHSGPLQVARLSDSAGSGSGPGDQYGGAWGGDLGTLNFLSKGVCTLDYYPSKGDNSQVITVRGSYEANGDTVRIEWQRNDRTPTLNMKLIYKHGVESTDSTASALPRLIGKNVKFELIPDAG
ncbi:hypothetical protein [Puia dinghuensis]|uniref:Lipoprotein n=1 Tax=Puia dinghuensis TaxID=1792502 RepID=A0A8J2UEZ9_9BACT|nr:hypothetical protein [Puia dinghuensis]GGB08846.1 hypothetical protein GCM10011511_35440 [Puia dinghuensis]